MNCRARPSWTIASALCSWSTPFLFGSTPSSSDVWRRFGGPLVQPLTSLAISFLSTTFARSPPFSEQPRLEISFKQAFGPCNADQDPSFKCCEITQFFGERNFWPQRQVIRRFIVVKFCNKWLQCVVFYESHLAIIKWENCWRQECFMMIVVTPVIFSLSLTSDRIVNSIIMIIWCNHHDDHTMWPW